MRFSFDVQPLDGPASSWAASSGCVRIGRDPANDLVLTSEMVSARHAVIEESGSIALLRDLQSSNGVFLNGARIAGSSRISVGDVIMFGQRGPTIRIGSLDAGPPVGATMAVPVGGSRSNHAGLRVGRAPDNDFVLDDPSVSAYHARFFVDHSGRGYVEDSGSLNGVAVGDPNRKISKAEVDKSDQVYFGSAALPATELFARCGSYGMDLDSDSTAKRSDSTLPLIAMFAVIGVAVLVTLCYMTFAWKPIASTEVAATKNVDADPKPELSSAFPATLGVPPISSSTNAPPRAAQARAERLDMISLNRDYGPAMVLVGACKKGADTKLVIPRAVAWAVKPTLLMTTAKTAAELKYCISEGDIEAVVITKDALIPVKAFRVNPEFNYDDPTSDGSRRHGIGFLEVEQPLESRNLKIPAPANRTLRPDAELAVIGYASSLDEGAPFDRVKMNPECGIVKILSAEDDRPGLPPLYSVEPPQLKGESSACWFDGSPIFNSSGAAVGILSVVKQRIRMISLAPAADLVP
jgi:pSer/pThr/pTyr-binding forkhead associated (FHA) protein